MLCLKIPHFGLLGYTAVYTRLQYLSIRPYTLEYTAVYLEYTAVYWGYLFAPGGCFKLKNSIVVPFVPILLHSLPLPNNCTPLETNLGSYFTHDCNVCLHMCPFQSILCCFMVSITWHTRNTWEYTGKKGGFGRKGYVACTGGYECIMHNACIGGLGNTSSLPIVMINFVFENTPFWALGVYGRILKAPIPQYTAVYSGVYGRILRVYGRILGVFVCTMWLFQVEKFHCCAFCAHLVAFFAFAQQLHTT